MSERQAPRRLGAARDVTDVRATNVAKAVRAFRAVCAVCAVALVLLSSGTAARADPSPLPTPPPTSGPTPSAGPDNEAPLRVSVTDLLPRAPEPGGFFEVTGTVTNIGSQSAAAVRVQLRLGDRISTRGGLHDADRDRPPTSRRVYVVPDPADLAPGQVVRFDLRATVDSLGLGPPGVYPLDVEATARYGEAERSRLGTVPTWLPWMAGQRVVPVRVAVLWPLVDAPHRGPDEAVLDDRLASLLPAGGRLGRLLAVARAARLGRCDGLPHLPEGAVAAPPPRTPRRCPGAELTLAVDPDLLQTIETMTTPYVVRSASSSTPGTGTEAARAWLAGLRTLTGTADVLALPFGDPDVAALSRDARGRLDVALARALGDQVLQDSLGHRPLDTVAWPPAGPVPPAAQDTLSVDGTRDIVLDPSAFSEPAQDPEVTPVARTPLPAASTGRTLTGLVPDADLSQLLSGMARTGLGPRLAEQRWIAETAIVAAERPSLSRTLLVAPERRGDVVPAIATAQLLDLGRLPWLCSVPVADVARGDERCPGRPAGEPTSDDRGDPRLGAAGELSSSYLAGVAGDRDTGVQLAESVLAPRDKGSTRTRTQLRRMVARAESSAWRSDPTGGRRAAGLLHSTVSRLVDGLTVRGAPLLLTSTRGTLSVSVDNRLDVPVSCAVSFAPPAGAALSTYRTPVRTIAAHSSAQLSVRATARTSGRFVVVARLLDREGRPFGRSTQVDVRSTRYGRLALAVTAVGAGVLLVAAGLRIVRRALSAQRRAGSS